MKVTIKNLGVLESAEYEIGDLTIICGENNTGKTYISYSLFGILEFVGNIQLPSITETSDIQKFMSEVLWPAYRPFLHQIFASTEELFKSAKLIVSIDEVDIEKYKTKLNGDCIDSLNLLFPHPHYLTADRGGIVTLWGFYDLPADSWKALWKNENDNTRKSGEPTVPLPVRRDLDFYRELRNGSYRNPQKLHKKCPEIVEYFQKILGGDFAFVNGVPVFKPKNYAGSELRMSESSSSVRSLFLLGNYLRYVAAPGDLLMIDEPELNLHPEKQRLIARLFARLVNAGIKVLITTHSDYIVKELNTLIMLNRRNENDKDVMKRYGYSEEELLDPAKVRVYMAQEMEPKKTRTKKPALPKCTLIPAEIDELGIYLPSFDNSIDEMNNIQNEILKSLS